MMRLASLTEIDAAIWHELAQCARDRQHPWRTLVLATTDGEVGDARTVILRETVADEKRLVLYTDQRSGKVAQVGAHPVGTLVMWSPRLGWQLRCRVRVSLETAGLAVTSRWAAIQLSPAAQDYLSAQAPGSKLSAAPASVAAPLPVTTGQGQGALPSFAVMEAQVLSIDWLELHADGHRRAIFGAEGPRWVQP